MERVSSSGKFKAGFPDYALLFFCQLQVGLLKTERPNPMAKSVFFHLLFRREIMRQHVRQWNRFPKPPWEKKANIFLSFLEGPSAPHVQKPCSSRVQAEERQAQTQTRQPQALAGGAPLRLRTGETRQKRRSARFLSGLAKTSPSFLINQTSLAKT